MHCRRITQQNSAYKSLSLSLPVKEKLAAVLPWYARAENPVDATGQLAAYPSLWHALRASCASPSSPPKSLQSASSSCHRTALPSSTRLRRKPWPKSPNAATRLSYISTTFRRRFDPTCIKCCARPAFLTYNSKGIRAGLKAVKSYVDFHASRDRARPGARPRIDIQRQTKARAMLKGSAPYLCEDIGKTLLSLYGSTVPTEIAGALGCGGC